MRVFKLARLNPKLFEFEFDMKFHLNLVCCPSSLFFRYDFFHWNAEVFPIWGWLFSSSLIFFSFFFHKLRLYSFWNIYSGVTSKKLIACMKHNWTPRVYIYIYKRWKISSKLDLTCILYLLYNNSNRCEIVNLKLVLFFFLSNNMTSCGHINITDKNKWTNTRAVSTLATAVYLISSEFCV